MILDVYNNKESDHELYGKYISQVMLMLQSICVRFTYNNLGRIMTRNHWKGRNESTKNFVLTYKICV